jgi:GTP-binding protein EngB required for normal cell division
VFTGRAVAMPTRCIFIGNPGNGKSTLLSILCNTPHFKGGYSVGTGLTTELAELTIGDITYMDIPGLYDIDPTKHANASAEISKALKRGGEYKVIFVVGDQNGRVLTEDVATMNMVLAAAPEITMNNFGIIVNMACKKTMTLPQTGNDSQLAFTTSLFCKRPDVSTAHILFLPVIADMEGASSEAMNLAAARGLSEIQNFMNFVTKIPSVTLTIEKVSDINHTEVDAYIAEVSKSAKELDNNEAMKETFKKQIAANNNALIGTVANAERVAPVGEGLAAGGGDSVRLGAAGSAGLSHSCGTC